MNTIDTWQISIGAIFGPSRASSLEILKNIFKNYYKNGPKKHVVGLDLSLT
jgi:hypothetical protein